MKALSIFTSITLIIIFVGMYFWFRFFAPTSQSKELEVFVVSQNQEIFEAVKDLEDQNFIRNADAFQFLLNNFGKVYQIEPGGYRISKNMNAWEIMKKVESKPDLLWVTISFCARKEQVGEILAEALGWDKSQLDRWNSLYKNTQTEYFEGVYYPDTYLIPIDEPESEVAQRFVNRFNEKFAPLMDISLEKNIKWTNVLKIASLIAREAGGVDDMKLISGVIWNRLDLDMPLQIDATMQYTLGKKSNGSWWGSIDLDEKQSDSPYNSYKNKGLPPTAICSPNFNAMDAALNPEETECIFYLHDKNKQIHCAKTYEEHLDNIEVYLRQNG